MALAPRIDSIQAGQNLAINGNFDFWQRNTSFTSVANGAYTTDRWQWANNTSTVFNITRSTDVPTLVQSGFVSQYSLLATVASGAAAPAANQIIRLNYKVEGYDYANLHGKPFRPQFWIKTSVPGIYSVSLQNSSRTRLYTTSVQVFSANTWERKTIDLVGDTSGTWLFDNQVGLHVEVVLAAGADYKAATVPNAWASTTFGTGTAVSGQANLCATNGATLQLAQFMIVPGSFNSDNELVFKRAGRTIADELAMCQRYYYALRGTETGSNFQEFAIGGTLDQTTYARYVISLPVTMRTVPNLDSSSASVFVNLNSSGAQAGTAISIGQSGTSRSTQVVAVELNSAGLATNQCTALRANNSSGAFLNFSAEL